MSNQYIGEIRPTPYNFFPQGWALCDGSLISIADNSALFTLLGTTYGGDGVTNFGLPDLRSRIPISCQQGTGLSSYTLGEKGGTEAVTLTANNIPGHSHAVSITAGAATSLTPVGNFPAQAAKTKVYGTATTTNLALDTVGVAGQGMSHVNIQPFNVVNYIIALEGIYPSQG